MCWDDGTLNPFVYILDPDKRPSFSKILQQLAELEVPPEWQTFMLKNGVQPNDLEDFKSKVAIASPLDAVCCTAIVI